MLQITMATVLIVDDEPASLRAVQRALADDCDVMAANGAQQALAALAGVPVAMLIADQRMPGMLGTELLASCAVQAPEVIRILLTGYTDIETLVEAINAGHVYAYLTKPWEPSELRLVVRRGLEHHAVEAERRRLVRALEQSCERNRREAAQKTRLLAVAAHELGTPLHVLANALELLAATALPPEAGEWLDAARRSATWLGRGLAQLSRGARSQPERLQLRCRLVDIGRLLRDLVASFAAALAARKLRLGVDVPAEGPLLDVDPVWLRRALANVLSNAIRFTPDGGQLRLTVRAEAATLTIAVADTGIGIEPGVLEEIFEPFSEAGGDLLLHTSGGLEFGSRGLGLGLAIAKAVLEQHGGCITVDSRPGGGSCFTCVLPRRGGTAAETVGR
jgi:two-component system sensor histidine kinase/response regulator